MIECKLDCSLQKGLNGMLKVKYLMDNTKLYADKLENLYKRLMEKHIKFNSHTRNIERAKNIHTFITQGFDHYIPACTDQIEAAYKDCQSLQSDLNGGDFSSLHLLPYIKFFPQVSIITFEDNQEIKSIQNYYDNLCRYLEQCLNRKETRIISIHDNKSLLGVYFEAGYYSDLPPNPCSCSEDTMNLSLSDLENLPIFEYVPTITSGKGPSIVIEGLYNDEVHFQLCTKKIVLTKNNPKYTAPGGGAPGIMEYFLAKAIYDDSSTKE